MLARKYRLNRARAIIKSGRLSNASYDLNIQFKALPKIPVILQFNDTDEIFPAQAVFLFYDDAVQYLDLRSLAGIITYLTGLLISSL